MTSHPIATVQCALTDSGVTVYFIPRIFYPGDSIYYPGDSISLVYFIPRQDILSLHGDQGMSQNISVATQSVTRNVRAVFYARKAAQNLRVFWARSEVLSQWSLRLDYRLFIS